MTTQSFFFVFIPILASLLLIINILLAPHNPYEEKNSVFECGFHSFLGQNRSEFNISFFVFALLFLVFDIEVSTLYPFILSAYTTGTTGMAILLIFFTVLTLGFAYELGKGALSIDSRQDNEKQENDNAVNSNYTISQKFSLKKIGTPNVNKRFFSNTTHLNSSNSSDKGGVPINSVASNNSSDKVGASISSGATDRSDDIKSKGVAHHSDTDSSNMSTSRKNAAESSRLLKLQEESNKEHMNPDDYIKSPSGNLIKDITPNDIGIMAKKVDLAGNEGQEVYDECHDKINTAYAIHKENLLIDKKAALNELERRKGDIEEERKEIENSYNDTIRENENYVNFLKSEFVTAINRKDIHTRGLDESNKESVEYFLEKLKESNLSNSGRNSLSSLNTHTGLDPVIHGSSSIIPEIISTEKKIEVGSAEKKVEIGSAEKEVEVGPANKETSKSIKQDSSDITSDCEPMDISFDE